MWLTINFCYQPSFYPYPSSWWPPRPRTRMPQSSRIWSDWGSLSSFEAARNQGVQMRSPERHQGKIFGKHGLLRMLTIWSMWASGAPLTAGISMLCALECFARLEHLPSQLHSQHDRKGRLRTPQTVLPFAAPAMKTSGRTWNIGRWQGHPGAPATSPSWTLRTHSQLQDECDNVLGAQRRFKQMCKYVQGIFCGINGKWWLYWYIRKNGLDDRYLYIYIYKGSNQLHAPLSRFSLLQ